MGMQKITHKKVIEDIIRIVENADNNMEIDGVRYKTPRLYTIALIKEYERLNRDSLL